MKMKWERDDNMIRGRKMRKSVWSKCKYIVEWWVDRSLWWGVRIMKWLINSWNECVEKYIKDIIRRSVMLDV